MLSFSAQIILFVLWLLLTHVGLYKLFEKAGVPGWKAFVPVLNKLEWLKLIGQPSWRYILLLIPLVNIFIYVGMLIDLVRSFGKHGFWEHVLAVAATPFYYPYLGFVDKEAKYTGPIVEQENAYKQQLKEAEASGNKAALRKLERSNPNPNKSFLREWSEAIIFAVFAATFIRMFMIEAYTIPTPSMEGSLLVGDFLFVSKMHYGTRMPNTPLQFPLVHNKIPILNTESYSRLVEWPYKRLPKITEIERFDPVVFNFPAGDTIIEPKNGVGQVIDYHGFKRQYGMSKIKRDFKVISRPVDRRDNYIKRCVALPGDEMEIRDQQLYINGAAVENPKKIQFQHDVYATQNLYTKKILAKLISWGIPEEEIAKFRGSASNQYRLNLNPEQVDKLRNYSGVIDSVKIVKEHQQGKAGFMVFPNDPVNYPWNVDWFGPLKIPKKGETVQLDMKNISLYRRVIETYEDNKFQIKGNQILINGAPATSYTFKMDYYFMMGDNRHNSFDSRGWGMVPEDHVVGKPLFIWFSYKGGEGIRWDRLFSTANKF